MADRFTQAAAVESADKIAGAVLALFAAAVVLSEAAGGPRWVSIALAVLGTLGATIALSLKVLHELAQRRQRRAELWRTKPLRMRQIIRDGRLYEIGVDAEAPESLLMLGTTDQHAAYVEREIDRGLCTAIARAGSRLSESLIVVSGRSKTGKSRTLLENASAALPDAWLIVPRDARALAELARAGPPPEIGSGPCALWIDDIELFARPADQGLSAETLAALRTWRMPVLVLATEGGKGVDLSGACPSSRSATVWNA